MKPRACDEKKEHAYGLITKLCNNVNPQGKQSKGLPVVVRERVIYELWKVQKLDYFEALQRWTVPWETAVSKH